MDDSNTEEIDFLKKQVEDLRAQCREQERNILLAAEIGQQLLQENEQLKSQFTVTVESKDAESQTINQDSSSISQSSVSSSSVVVDKDWLSDLESKVEQYMEENKVLRDDHSLQTRELSKTICEIRQENNELRQKMTNLSGQLEKAQKEISARIAKEQQVFEPLKKKVKSLSCHEKAMDDRIEELEKENQQLAWELKNMANTTSATEQSFRLQQDELQDALEKAQNEAVEKGKEWEWLQIELDHVRNMLLEKQNELEATLKSKSIALGGNDNCDDNQEDPTTISGSESLVRPSLFNEVEDRRLELESQHSQLKDIHHGLMEKHDKAIRQQRKLTSHVKRMSQVTSSVGTTLQSTERLQQALSKSMQEKRELMETIQELEKKVKLAATSSNLNHTPVTNSNGNSENLKSLNFSEVRARQLAEECETLTCSLQSLKSQLFECQTRIRMMEVKMAEQSKIIDMYKIKYVQAQVQAELGQDEPDLEVDIDDLDLVKSDPPPEAAASVDDVKEDQVEEIDEKENDANPKNDVDENTSISKSFESEDVASIGPSRIVIAPTTTSMQQEQQCNQQ